MDNPYQAPNSRIDLVQGDQQELASRGSRFGASLVDAVILMAVLIPIEYAAGYIQQAFEAGRTHETLPLGTVLMWSFIGIAIFALIQGYPLLKSGQTWGKKICSIKIVSLGGGLPPVQQLMIRYGVYMLVGVVPVVGMIGSFVNILLIFRSDKRCGHDLAAGTQVVKA